MSAVDLKEQGNKLFSVRKYDDAISCYTKAIVSEQRTVLSGSNNRFNHADKYSCILACSVSSFFS